MTSTAGGAIVGREAELGAVRAFLAARDDLPAALLIEGEPGIGKTTLWQDGVVAAERSGYRVLACRPAGGETELSFAAISDLLEADANEFLPMLPAPQRRALAVALLLHDEDGRPPDPRAIAAGVLGAVRALARERPLLIAIDDGQWLDAASAAAIEYTVRRLTPAAVAVLVSSRPQPSSASPLDLERALGDRLTRVRVGPMSFGALHRLLHERTGRSFNRPTLRRIYDTSGANPFFALELARALHAETGERAPGEPLELSSSLNELLDQRLAGLGDSTRDALFVAAATSRPTLPLLEAVLGESPSSRLAPAIAAGIVRVEREAVVFAHPLLSAAAYARLDEPDRRRWHARLAEVSTEFEERARHRAMAVSGPDPDVAELLEEAGQRARARGAPATAAELLGLAIARTPSADVEHRARRTVAAVPAMLLAGDRQGARALLETTVASIEPGPMRSEALLLLSELVEDDPGGDARTIELLEQATREAGGDPRRQAVALLNREMWERHKDRLGDALGVAREALALAEQAGDATVLAHALTRTADLEVLLGQSEDPIAHFRRALELDTVARIDASLGPGAMLAVCLIRAGRLEEARPMLLAQRRRSEEEGDEASRARLCLFLAELAWLAGRWEDARAYTLEGLDVAEQAASRVLEGALLALQALVEASGGQVEQARAHGIRGMELCEQIGEDSYAIYNRQVLGFLELSLGDAARAHKHLAVYSVERGIEGTKRISFIGDEIEALVRLGDLDAAEALTEELERRGELLHRPSLSAVAARSRGLALAMRGETQAAVEHIGRAMTAFNELGMPFEEARALLVLGEVHRRGKHKRAGREALEAAVAAFEGLGAPLWADKARAELARIGGRTAEGGLTPTERRVAELVAAGRSNKEVAAELFVTVRAVEANLSRVYAKVGVRSRTELARQLRPE